ncbi:MAG: hypothetical protein IJR60_05060 [Eubacterium sp.]|nr:hypothetical protein [Eubacterium sp.]
MAYKLVDGDYVIAPGHTAPTECDYIDELAQNAMVVLGTKRSKFYPNKDFGSYIYITDMQPLLAYLDAAARQAVDPLDGVYIKSVSRSGQDTVIVLTANDTERTVIIKNENNI